MNTTPQQQAILEAVQNHRNIKINAFAGTGKTTTLRLIAQTYQAKKILYLAFNTAIKNEATGLFPSNTSVKTTHGLAFVAIKKHTNLNLDTLVNYRAIDIAKEFEISYGQAIGTLKIFENFCNNTQEEMGKDDIEHRSAKKMFDYMLIGKMEPTHGFYLKYYYLLLVSGQIPQFGYDIIMLDELSLEDMRTAVKINAGQAKLEASGGVNEQTIRAIAQTGVDYISLGTLTKDVKAVDLSMRLSL